MKKRVVELKVGAEYLQDDEGSEEELMTELSSRLNEVIGGVLAVPDDLADYQRAQSSVRLRLLTEVTDAAAS